jgi:hypothetical protein
MLSSAPIWNVAWVAVDASNVRLEAGKWKTDPDQVKQTIIQV